MTNFFVGPHWEPSLLIHPDSFVNFWNLHLSSKSRHILYILGHGFDPRMCEGIQRLNSCGSAIVDVWLIEFNEGPDSPSATQKKYVDKNLDQLLSLHVNSLERKNIIMWSVDSDFQKRRIGSSRAGSLFNTFDFSNFTDIVVDISALPRGLYFPIIKKLLDQCFLSGSGQDRFEFPNLHVIVCENASLDSNIQDRGLDERAAAIPGFISGFEPGVGKDEPTLWLPLLGEGQLEQLQKIFELVAPKEICPLLPSPARNPRRSDDLIMEYHRLLFDTWNLDPRDFIYVTERNPFDVYRQLCEIVRNFDASMRLLGNGEREYRVALSAQSSKLMSIGMLLAAHELINEQLPVSLFHVDALGYDLDRSQEDVTFVSGSGDLFSLFLSGEYYV